MADATKKWLTPLLFPFRYLGITRLSSVKFGGMTANLTLCAIAARECRKAREAIV